MLYIYLLISLKVDLGSHQVTTIAGTGSPGMDYKGGKIGIEQEISSPWDVALG